MEDQSSDEQIDKQYIEKGRHPNCSAGIYSKGFEYLVKLFPKEHPGHPNPSEPGYGRLHNCYINSEDGQNAAYSDGHHCFYWHRWSSEQRSFDIGCDNCVELFKQEEKNNKKYFIMI
jgi:hypothetical protein